MTTTAKTRTVADMPDRQIFDSVDSALAFLNAAANEFTDWGNYPFVAPGIEDGNFDLGIYNDSMNVMVQTMKTKGKTKFVDGKEVKLPGTIRAIVVSPSPKTSAILEAAGGAEWIDKILAKEISLVALRKIRDSHNLAADVALMPTTIAGYLESGRGDSGSTMLASYAALWAEIKAVMVKNSKPFARAKAALTRAEFKKCLESRGYALEMFATLEDRGEGKTSLFVTALQLLIRAAEKKAMDTTLFDRWLATRDAKTYDAELDDEDDDADLDLDALADMLTDSTDEAPAGGDADEAAGEAA